MYSARPYILAENNWESVRETDYQVAILPWGATEAHNYHLPYATDNYQCDYVAAESARLAWEAGRRCVVFPTVPFGVNTGQLDVDLCLNMNPSTQLALLKDLVQVLSLQKLQKLVILNGHGGNYFKQMIREIYGLYPDVFVCTLNWWQAVDWNIYFDDPGDHAGEMETSAILHISPDLVRPLSEAGDGAAKTFAIQGIKEGWVHTQRKWTEVTEDTGVGNPYPSTAKKGAKYLKETCEKIGSFLIELADADLNSLYE
ncbi:MAG: creatininase family protein [Bacteroidota bacterium]